MRRPKSRWVDLGNLLDAMTFFQGNWRFQLHLLAKHCDIMGYARTMRMNHYRTVVATAVVAAERTA